MMTYALFSDTHGHIKPLVEALEKETVLTKLISLGDFTRDAEKIAAILNKPLTMVCGNCDIFDRKTASEEIITLGNLRVLLTHGHHYGVKNNLNRLYYRTYEAGCDMVFFGHTHIYLDQMLNAIRFINPGSAAYPRMPLAAPSWIKLEVDENHFSVSKMLLT